MLDLKYNPIVASIIPMPKRACASPGQLSLPGFNISTPFMPDVLQTVTIPVGITFDPCQGLREAKQKIAMLRARHGNQLRVQVEFDARHLELISEYTTLGKELLELEQLYITGTGGLLNLNVPMNLLRVAGTLWKWNDAEYQRTGTQPISRLMYKRPSPNTLVGQLWDVLGMEGLTKRPPQNDVLRGVLEFQSRYVTPFLYVTEESAPQEDIRKKSVKTYFQNWVFQIQDRLGKMEDSYPIPPLQAELVKALPEIIDNVVNHAGGGLVGLSVWPSGQIEITWSNPLDKTDPPWPPGDEPQVLAESLQNSKSGGAGIKFICNHLLEKYSGVLLVSWQTYHVAFRSGGDISIFGLYPRTKEFVPRSILFNLHLFSQDTRTRGK